MLLYFQKSAARLLHGQIIRRHSSYVKKISCAKTKRRRLVGKKDTITKNYMKENRVFAEPAVSKCISQAKQKMRRNAGRLIGVLQKGE